LRLIVVGSGIVGASCAHAASSLGAERTSSKRATAAGGALDIKARPNCLSRAGEPSA